MAQQNSRAGLFAAVLVGLILVVGAWLVFGRSGSGPTGTATGDGAATGDGCVSLQVTASSEKAGVLTELVTEYNEQGPEVAGRCVFVQVSAKSSGGTAQALSRGWDEVLDGPRPDVWTPASSSWPVLVQQWRAEADLPDIIPAESRSLVQTPLVIAMPRPMAEELGWPDKQLGWSDLSRLSKDPKGWGAVGRPEWGKFKLGKTNPNFSTSGLNATIGAYFAATGVSSDLTVKQVRAPKTESFIKQLESSVVHYGDTTLTFLETMSREAEQGSGLTYVSAVTVEEKSVLDFNQGNPSGDPQTLAQATPPAVPLAAVYPKEGTLLSDNPWLPLAADWVSPDKKQASDDLLTWLREPDQQARFTDVGFRTFEGTAGDVINPDNGMLAQGPASVISPPAPAVLAEVLQNWDDLRKRARVLYVMDISGSMSQPVPEAGQSKLDLAQEGAINTLDGFAGDDEVGLWVFSTDLGEDGEPYLELVQIGKGSKTVPKMKKEIAKLVAFGGTGLYATLRVAQEQMFKELETDRINAIVLLSDGKNEYPPDTDLQGLLEQLQGESADTTIRVFTIGYGAAADSTALEAIAEASRGRYYDAVDPSTIEEVLTSVLSNF